MPSDLSEALVLYRTELHKLQQRVHQLEAEKVDERNLHRLARQQRNKLVNEGRDKNGKIQGELFSSPETETCLLSV